MKLMYLFQLIRLNSEGQLGVGERCIDADNQGIKMIFCRLGTVDGPWQYDEVCSRLKVLIYYCKNLVLIYHQLVFIPLIIRI